MIRIPFIDTPRQALSIIGNGQRMDLGLDYNTVSQRWSMDLESNVGSFFGRRLVKDTNIMPKSMQRNLGGLVVCNNESSQSEIPRDGFASGNVQIFHADPSEFLSDWNSTRSYPK